MKKVTTTLSDIKAIKTLIDAVEKLKEASLVNNGDGETWGDKTALIEAKEKSITNNIHITANLLKVDFDTVVDMCYDFDFAAEVFKNINLLNQ